MIQALIVGQMVLAAGMVFLCVAFIRCLKNITNVNIAALEREQMLKIQSESNHKTCMDYCDSNRASISATQKQLRMTKGELVGEIDQVRRQIPSIPC